MGYQGPPASPTHQPQWLSRLRCCTAPSPHPFPNCPQAQKAIAKGLFLCRLRGFPPWPCEVVEPKSRECLQGSMNRFAPQMQSSIDLQSAPAECDTATYATITGTSPQSPTIKSTLRGNSLLKMAHKILILTVLVEDMLLYGMRVDTSTLTLARVMS